MSLPSTLDVSRLLQLHCGLSLIAAVSTSPIYNLPLALYGLVVVDKGNAGEFGTDGLRQVSESSCTRRDWHAECSYQFAVLLAVSGVLDIFVRGLDLSRRKHR